MSSSRNPSKDLVAFAGAASTGFQAQNTEQSQLELALRACIAVLKQCGLRASDIDGICGTSTPEARRIQSGLGIDEVTWFANPVMPPTAFRGIQLHRYRIPTVPLDRQLALGYRNRRQWLEPSAMRAGHLDTSTSSVSLESTLAMLR